MNECVFCHKIENWDFEQSYNGRTVVRFEPLNPVTPGHMLFIPGWHSLHPDPNGVRVAMAYAEEYARTKKRDYNLITSSGAAATQTVPHLHVHYVPRAHHDGLHLPWTGKEE